MWKYQYDDEFYIAEEAHVFPDFLKSEEEEAYAAYLQYSKT